MLRRHPRWRPGCGRMIDASWPEQGWCGPEPGWPRHARFARDRAETPVAGASGNQPRSSVDGLRSVTGCPPADEGDERTGRHRHQEGLIFSGPLFGCDGADVDLSVQLLLSSVGDIKQVGPGRVADNKDVDVTWRRAGLSGAPTCPGAVDVALADAGQFGEQ